ncbi:hypothetical protein AYO40_02455 [Planctomycetaceae bacterium SCGC AG-212-D15]|nr:hypothetical protein AYO40_02455 [Planctomycetaceae bacterium SCGC AG-212-D15]
MTTHGNPLGAMRWVPGTLLVCLALAVPLARPALAASARPVAAPTAPLAIAAPPVAAWYDKIWNTIERNLSSRQGAIQFGLIGMLICLWIIWWRPRR